MNKLEINGVGIERENLLAAANLLTMLKAHKETAAFLYALERAALMPRAAAAGTGTIEVGVDR